MSGTSSGWIGRFAQTVRVLATRPGELTVDYLTGNASRFVSPLQLYGTICIVYFALFALPADRPAASPTPSAIVSAEDRQLLLPAISDAPAILRPVMRAIIENPEGFERNLSRASPETLFALLPVFAGILALFYRTRPFADHLVFAVHVHAFTFAALAVMLVAKVAHSDALSLALEVVALFGIPYYWHAALRRVYATTLLGELAIGAIYAVVSIAGVLALTVS